jgi:hypothetical protein
MEWVRLVRLRLTGRGVARKLVAEKLEQKIPDVGYVKRSLRAMILKGQKEPAQVSEQLTSTPRVRASA